MVEDRHQDDGSPIEQALREIYGGDKTRAAAMAKELVGRLHTAGYQVVTAPSASDSSLHLNLDAAICPLCRAEHQFSKVDLETGERIFYSAHNAGSNERLERMREEWEPAWATDPPATPDTPLDAPHPYLRDISPEEAAEWKSRHRNHFQSQSDTLNEDPPTEE